MDARIDTRTTPEDPKFKPNFEIPTKVFDFCEPSNEDYKRFLKAKFNGRTISFCPSDEQLEEIDRKLNIVWLNGYAKEEGKTLKSIGEKFGVDPVKLLYNYEFVGSTFSELFKGLDVEMFISFNTAYTRCEYEEMKGIKIDKLLEQEQNGKINKKGKEILSSIRVNAKFYNIASV